MIIFHFLVNMLIIFFEVKHIQNCFSEILKWNPEFFFEKLSS